MTFQYRTPKEIVHERMDAEMASLDTTVLAAQAAGVRLSDPVDVPYRCIGCGASRAKRVSLRTIVHRPFVTPIKCPRCQERLL